MSHCALDSDLSPTVLDFLQSQSQIQLMLRPHFASPSLRRYGGHRVRLEQFLTSCERGLYGLPTASYGSLLVTWYTLCGLGYSEETLSYAGRIPRMIHSNSYQSKRLADR